jgi:hypothetical protein
MGLRFLNTLLNEDIQIYFKEIIMTILEQFNKLIEAMDGIETSFKMAGKESEFTLRGDFTSIIKAVVVALVEGQKLSEKEAEKKDLERRLEHFR